MMIGYSVDSDLFLDGKLFTDSRILCDAYGGKEAFWERLKESVDSVEICGIGAYMNDPQRVLDAVRLCEKSGLNVTFHGNMSDGPDCVDELFRPYLPVFASGIQPLYNITLHPEVKRTETQEMMERICSYADEKGYPVTFTLENLRYNDPSNVEMLCSSVALTVSNVGSERLGVCFDMGHRLSSLNKFGEDSDPADDSFYSLVRHTHIHSLYKGVTHLPLTVGKSALDENLSALARNGYRGVLNLEVNLGRFDEPFDAKESFEGSVRILKEAASRAFGDN